MLAGACGSFQADSSRRVDLACEWICSQLPADVSREALAVPSAGPASGRCAEARALPRPVRTERAVQEGLRRDRWPELRGEIGVEGEP